MRWDSMPSARDVAPTAFKDWEVLRNEADTAVDGALLALIQERIEVLLAGATSVHTSAGDAEDSCAEAIEQFFMDVSALNDTQRDAVHSALGSRAYPFFQVLYVRDFDFRSARRYASCSARAPSRRRSLRRPLPPEPPDLWPALDRFLTDVASLDALDPVTTELIRLRGARAHNCRICQSRRESHRHQPRR